MTCACCGHKTRAAYDEDTIPASSFGPRLMSIVALLTGVYHVSRRKTATLLSDLVGVPISLGAISSVEARVSDAVKAGVDEAWMRVEGAAVKHTDGTSWLKAGTLLALWTIATTAATVFKIVTDGSRATLAPLYGALRGILVSDRATALGFWAMERRQICWAHLLRKAVSFSERDGPSAAFGRTSRVASTMSCLARAKNPRTIGSTLARVSSMPAFAGTSSCVCPVASRRTSSMSAARRSASLWWPRSMKSPSHARASMSGSPLRRYRLISSVMFGVGLGIEFAVTRRVTFVVGLVELEDVRRALYNSRPPRVSPTVVPTFIIGGREHEPPKSLSLEHLVVQAGGA